MKTYTILRKTDWDLIPEFEISERCRPFDADIRAYGKICYDDEALYLRLRAYERDIRAEQCGPFDMPCDDSCLEFFFSPDENSRRYFNIEMNPNCSVFLGIGTSIKDLARLRMMNQREYGFSAVSERTETGWMLAYSVPFGFIRLFFPGFDPKPGDVLMANAYKCGGKCSVPHWLAWNPVDMSVPHSFHNPDCFGKMIFG